MPNANLQVQIQNVMVGHDESLATKLDMLRSEYRMWVDQVLNANSAAGVASATDMTFVGGSASNWAASNRLFHVKNIYLANFTGAAHCRIDLYDNSVGGVNTMASFTLQTQVAGVVGGSNANNNFLPLFQLQLDDLQGLIFSTGFAVAQATNSNTVIMLGGVLRPKMGFELQSAIAPLD